MNYPNNPLYPPELYPPKEALGEVAVDNGIDYSPLGRLEPLVTPQQIRSRLLWGLPLVSSTKDPITNRYAVMTDDEINDFILSAVVKVESDIGIDIYPVRRLEKHPFDVNLYQSFGHLVTKHSPILTVNALTVTPSNGRDIFRLPLEWLENANFVRGQINIVPMTIAAIGGNIMSPVQSGGGAAFLHILGMRGWIPAFWQVDYVAGFNEGKIPRYVNDLIGIRAALDILGTMGATNKQSSYSLSLDGLGQSASTPGPQVYSVRLEQLERERMAMTAKLKSKFGRKFFVGHI